ncbi:MAG: RNA polymerase sigma factor [Gemmatimonadales bacterium]
MTGDTDGQLIARVLAGEREVYSRLVDRYQDRLGRYALRMLGNRADAEDALQDTFVRAFRSLANCTRPEGFGPWVWAILVNRCRTHASRRARVDGVMVASELALAQASVDHSIDRDAIRDAIDWALAQLPADQREAFLLKHVEDQSYDMMEETTGVRAATLRMRVFRAREELRRLLAEEVRD